MIFGLFGMLFTDCNISSDTGETGEVEQTVWIETISYECSQSSWTYTITTVGDSGGLRMNVHDTSQADYMEVHSAPYPAESDATYTYSLSIVFSEGDVTDGLTTIYACPTEGEPEMIWHLELFDADGRINDCAAFGDDPGTLDTGCPIWQ